MAEHPCGLIYLKGEMGRLQLEASLAEDHIGKIN
jgi:hypothetical protein